MKKFKIGKTLFSREKKVEINTSDIKHLYNFEYKNILKDFNIDDFKIDIKFSDEKKKKDSKIKILKNESRKRNKQRGNNKLF